MAYYIERNASPVDDRTFVDFDAAVAALRAPGWPGGPEKELKAVDDITFLVRGEVYVIVQGENPKAARQAAKAAAVARANAASIAQVQYIVALRDRVPESAYQVITGGKDPCAMDRKEASSVISRLLVVAQA